MHPPETVSLAVELQPLIQKNAENNCCNCLEICQENFFSHGGDVLSVVVGHVVVGSKIPSVERAVLSSRILEASEKLPR